MYRSSEREKPRLARLTAILNQLQGKVMVTATELAQKHGVSIRTIYRDIRTLEQSGVPIVTEEGKGYRILDGYYLAPVSFELSEAQALTTLQQIAPFLGDSSLSQMAQAAIEK
ncbi:MAG: HTH domain-containing protein, partial [Bacteroidota bacterium]